MSQYVVTDTELTAVANAIRSKGGTEADLEWPSAFVSAIGAITTGGGEPQSGGGSNIRYGVEEPASNLGNDGDVYFKCSFIPAGSTDYIRTNNVALNITLTNYTYNTNDKIQFVYKKASVQNSYWPVFLVAGYNSNSSALLLQENRYGGRQVINLSHAGAWAGDAAISVGTYIDALTDIKEIIVDGNIFTFKSDGAIVAGPVSVGTNTNSDSGNPILFPNLNAGHVFDVLFYRLAIYRNDVLIHDYRPATDGVIDVVTGDTFTTSETGYINGTAYSNDAYIVNYVYYKNSGSWSSINNANIEDINMNDGGGIPLLTLAQWNAITTAQKQAYGLVAIQDSLTGFDRGDLVNGSDYKPLGMYLPSSDETKIVCEAYFDNFDASSRLWGLGETPMFLATTASKNQDDSVAMLASSNGTYGHVDLGAQNTPFTAYIVAKLVNPGTYARIISAFSSRTSSAGIMLYGATVTVSSWANDTSTGVSASNDYFVGVIQFSSSGNALGLAASVETENPTIITKPPTFCGQYITIGRTDINADTANAEPSNMNVKYVAVVKEAESQATILANVQNLITEFLS